MGTGYLSGKLKGYGIFEKRFCEIEVLIFLKNKISLLVNKEGAWNSEKKKFFVDI